MHVRQVAFDFYEVDLRLDDDAREVALMSRLIAVEIHQHQVLERRDRNAYAEHVGRRGLRDHRALGLTRCDEQVDFSCSVRQHVHRFRVGVPIDGSGAAEAHCFEGVERLPCIVGGHDQVEILGEARQPPSSERRCTDDGERHLGLA